MVLDGFVSPIESAITFTSSLLHLVTCDTFLVQPIHPASVLTRKRSKTVTALQLCYHYRYFDTFTLSQLSDTQLAGVICIPREANLRERGHQHVTLCFSIFS